MVMWVVDMVFKTAILYNNVNFQVTLRILMILLKIVMVMWVVDMVL